MTALGMSMPGEREHGDEGEDEMWFGRLENESGEACLWSEALAT